MPHHWSCNCDGETRKKTKEQCVKNWKTMQGYSSHSSLDYTHTHTHTHSHTHTHTHKHRSRDPIDPSNSTMLQNPNVNEWDIVVSLTFQCVRVAILTSLTWGFTYKQEFTTRTLNCRWVTTPKTTSNRHKRMSQPATYQHRTISSPLPPPSHHHLSCKTTIANPIPSSHHPPTMNVKWMNVIVWRYLPSEYVIRCLSFWICRSRSLPLNSEFNLSRSWFNRISFDVSLYLIVNEVASSRFHRTFQCRRDIQANVWSQWCRCRIGESRREGRGQRYCWEQCCWST